MVSNRLGDEFHYPFECSYFVDQRQEYLPKDVIRRPNATGFEKLMNTIDLHALFQRVCFVKKFCVV